MDREKYLALLEPAINMVTKKQADYQGVIVGLHDYFPFGDKSYVQMLHVKTQRLVSLAGKGGDPTNESVKDSVLDLINYAVFYLDFLQKRAESIVVYSQPRPQRR